MLVRLAGHPGYAQADAVIDYKSCHQHEKISEYRTEAMPPAP
jgi:hypothetical protein